MALGPDVSNTETYLELKIMLEVWMYVPISRAVLSFLSRNLAMNSPS
jgi:hypothetical protein